MANICSTYVTITGDPALIKELGHLLKEQDKALLQECSHFENIKYYGMATCDVEDDHIFTDLVSKWSPPVEDLVKLSSLYPTLHIEYHSEEPGMSEYWESTIEGGHVTEESQFSEEEYLSEYDADYAEEKARVQEMDSKQAVEYILLIDEEDPQDPRWDNALEPIALERVATEDLPLLINHVWQSAEQAYKNRFQKVS